MTGPAKDGFVETLRREIARWVADGLISTEQAGRIMARYMGSHAPQPATAAKPRDDSQASGSQTSLPSKLIITLSILGAVLVGVGVILFMASNWAAIPRWGRLAILLSFMAACYGAGYYMRYESGGYPRVGASVILLGSIVFGANIYLIAQMFHISTHYPNGMLMWGLGVLPVAYSLNLRPPLFMSLLLLVIWTGMEASFHFRGGGSEIVYVMIYFMLGIVLMAIGHLHDASSFLRGMAWPYYFFGLFLTLCAGYVMTFDVLDENLGSPALIAFYSGLALVFVSSGAASISMDKSGQRVMRSIELGILAFLMIMAFALSMYFPDGVSRVSGTFDRVIASVIYFMLIIGAVVAGYIGRRAVYVNLGLLFFVLFVIGRYFDVFYRLMPRSLFFIAGGLLLIGGSIVLERQRRRIIGKFESGAVEQ